MKTAMEKTAERVAQAIASGKFGKEEHETVLTGIMEDADLKPHERIAESVRIGNVSAIRQKLEQAGVLGRSGGLTAFQTAVVKACQERDAKLNDLLK